jgi:hypothetical protein
LVNSNAVLNREEAPGAARKRGISLILKAKRDVSGDTSLTVWRMRGSRTRSVHSFFESGKPTKKRAHAVVDEIVAMTLELVARGLLEGRELTMLE